MSGQNGQETRKKLPNGREKVEWRAEDVAEDGEINFVEWTSVRPLGHKSEVLDLHSSVYEPETGLRRDVTWRRMGNGGQELSIVRRLPRKSS
ncbi:MAG TPA: hypothetical protein VF189_03850 [Patescibacteria group bacterium]